MWLDSSFQTTSPWVVQISRSRLLHTTQVAIAAVGAGFLVLYSHEGEEKQRQLLRQIPGGFCRVSTHRLAGLSNHTHGHTGHLD